MSSRLPLAQPISGDSSLARASATAARMVSACRRRSHRFGEQLLGDRVAARVECSRHRGCSSRPSAASAANAPSTRSARRRSPRCRASARGAADSIAAYSRPVFGETGNCLRACLSLSASAIASSRRTPRGCSRCAASRLGMHAQRRRCRRRRTSAGYAGTPPAPGTDAGNRRVRETPSVPAAPGRRPARAANAAAARAPKRWRRSSRSRDSASTVLPSPLARVEQAQVHAQVRLERGSRRNPAPTRRRR